METLHADLLSSLNTSVKFKAIDLFAGTGAFSYVLHETNVVETVFANDFDISSKKMYELNLDTKLCCEDLEKIQVKDIPEHDLICAGISCQPFSIAGNKKGFDDDRANVFWKMIEIIKHHKPKTVLIENVKNLKSHNKGDTLKTILNTINDLGYYSKYAILNTCKITSIPQNRERIFIISFLNKSHHDQFNFDFPQLTTDDIQDYLENEVDDKYYYAENSKVIHGIDKHVKDNFAYQYRRYYVRENKSSVVPTLTANMGTGGHNVPLIKDDKGIRKLTPRECFNLQGFPHDYKLPGIADSKLYKLAGNAVTIPVIKLIITKILDVIS